MKQLEGIVTSVKKLPTVTVTVTRHWTHPVYRKTVTRRKNYLCQSEIPLKIRDKVTIVECRPLSKLKKWRVVLNSPRKQPKVPK